MLSGVLQRPAHVWIRIIKRHAIDEGPQEAAAEIVPVRTLS